ncbi:putative membrane-associated kinase regulator [Helianthus anomalus]
MLEFHNHKPKSNKKEMKCEIEEVTISSLLNRDNSHDQSPSKWFSKEVVNRYLNLIKPFYIKVSRRIN